MITSNAPLIIYIVDDDADIRDSLAMLVQSAGFQARAFAGGEDILACAPSLTDGCLLLDVCLPGQDGVQVLRALRQRGVTLPAVLMSGHPGAVADARQALPGEIAVLQKPMSDEALFTALRAALRGSGDGHGNGHGNGGGRGGAAGADGAGQDGADDTGGPVYAVSTTQPCGYKPGHSRRYDFLKRRNSARRDSGRDGIGSDREEAQDND
jgi:DNA-binding response OmpR family regulator